MLLKELILINKKKSFEILDIQKKVSGDDLEKVINSHYLTDPYVRFVIVNSVAYLQECKDSLNYLKQKYAESEMKYDGIIEKYQICKNKNTNLQNHSVLLENNLNQMMEENQKLNEEKQFIMQNCMKNQNVSINPSFLHNFENMNLQRNIIDKENLSQYAFDDEDSSVNIYQRKAPLSSRAHNIQMSVDNENIMASRLGISQNFNKNASVLSNRISVDGFSTNNIPQVRNKNTSMLSNSKNCASSTSISFYKPHNAMKKYEKVHPNRSSVSLRSMNNSQNI